jgi:branched-chain amino acid transport system substrate-binding protein
VVGTVGSFSGPLSSSSGGVKDTLKAWVAWTNATGGINGHPVDLTIDDDGGNPTTAVADVQNLIRNDHVVAIVSDLSVADSAWAPIAEQAGVPVIGGNAIDLPFMTSPDFFASGTNTFAGTYGVEALGKTFGTKQAVLYCTETPACAASIPAYKAFAPSLGMTIPYTQSISASQADYTAVCQGIKQSGAESYVVVDAVAIVGRVADACRQQGVTAKVIEASAAVGVSLLTNKGADGLLSVAVDFPFTDNSVSATKQFHTVLAKYGPPNLEKEFGPALNTPWVALQLFAAAVKAAGSGPITADSLKNGLYTMKGETLGGIAPPLTFVKGQHNLMNCYFVLGIANGAFTAPDGLKTRCAPNAGVGALVDALPK